jgi:hypothetical protein
MVNTINNTDGRGFVKLSEYFSEIAKHISKTPAMMR